MIAATIYKKVRTFVQSGRIPKRDADDFAQDLYLRVLTRMRKSLAECREQNYINRIVHQQAINLLRYQYCGKRHTKKNRSLSGKFPSRANKNCTIYGLIVQISYDGCQLMLRGWRAN